MPSDDDNESSQIVDRILSIEFHGDPEVAHCQLNRLFCKHNKHLPKTKKMTDSAKNLALLR